jgi:TPR repeat protein
MKKILLLLILLTNKAYCETFEEKQIKNFSPCKKYQIENNYEKAKEYCEASAIEGYGPAQKILGYMYENGLGVEKNSVEAKRWYILANKYNEIRYEYKNELNEKYPELVKQALDGNPIKQNTIGHMYATGERVTKNIDEAVKWYKLAANQGQQNAQVSLGWYYMNGFENLPTHLIDYKEAKYWNELGAKNGCAEGYNNLGWIYENGLGVSKNYKKAAQYYQKAVTESIKNGVELKRITEARNRLDNVKVILSKINSLQKKQKPHKNTPIDTDPLNIRN